MNILMNDLDNIKFDKIGANAGKIDVISPVKRLKAFEFLSENREVIMDFVVNNGAVLLRGFKFNNAQDFLAAAKLLANDDLLNYENKSTPRTQIAEKVFTSTEYPSDLSIPLHNENSYTHKYPRYLYFFCLKNSPVGGQTPLADSAVIYNAIDPDIRKKFEDYGVTYIRNFGDVDLSWQEVFGTDCKNTVSNYCRQHNIQHEWDGERLKTFETRPATITHPHSRKKIWFNQAHLFHFSSVDAAASLLELYGMDNLPRNAAFGNGESFSPEVLANIREVLEQKQILFDWQPSDLLIVDNLRMAHGRRPYQGERKILVAMSHPNE